MKKYFLLYIVLALTTGTRLDFDSDDCKVYLEKFGTTNDADGAGASKIAFSGNVFFIGPTADVEIKLRYSDFDHFDDPNLRDLQDGKTPETTCLDMKLIQYSSPEFTGGVEVTDLRINPSENQTEKWRYYSFIIKGSELATRLIETKNSDNFLYKGYYAIVYYPIDTDKFFFTFNFGFSVTINRFTGAAVDSAFQPFDYYDYDYYEKLAYVCLAGETSIQWCTDFTCKSFSTPDLHFNDYFVLLFRITTSGLSNYLLTESEVRFTGNGLDKKATIVQFDNTTPGQLKLLLDADIVWRAVTIKVTSFLSKNPASINRLMEQTTFGFLTGFTDEIFCIKPEDSDVCGTCKQECDVNGFASDGCDYCSSAQIFYVILFGSLVFAF